MTRQASKKLVKCPRCRRRMYAKALASHRCKVGDGER